MAAAGRARRRDGEILYVDGEACPAAAERRHEQAAVSLAGEASVERDGLVGEIAVGLEAAAERIALECRVQGEREFARGDASPAQAVEIGSEMQVPARRLQHELALGTRRPADGALQDAEPGQRQRQIDLAVALTAAAGHLDS